jgi:hypothetical protein
MVSRAGMAGPHHHLLIHQQLLVQGAPLAESIVQVKLQIKLIQRPQLLPQHSKEIPFCQACHCGVACR